jgi:transposase
MSLELLAIDLGKRSFHLYGIDTDGVILSRKVSRVKLAEVVGNLAPTAIAMEACASAHYWGRCWLTVGREVRLINPRFVKPFVKGSKNDAVDAEAIFEAAMRPTMRFVPGSRPSRWCKSGRSLRWPSVRPPWVEVLLDRRRSAAV